MQPVHYTSDSPWAPARLGANRMRGAYAWNSLLKSGARLAFGSDFPVEEPDPRAGLAAAIAREQEGLTREAALAAFTKGAAFAAFQEHERGVIRAGLLADLAVVEGDFTSIPAADIPRMPVLYTIVGGKVVYQR